MAAQLEEGCYENYTIFSHIFQFENGLSNDDVGAARGNVLREIRPGAGSKPGDFVEKSWGCYRRTTLGGML